MDMKEVKPCPLLVYRVLCWLPSTRTGEVSVEARNCISKNGYRGWRDEAPRKTHFTDASNGVVLSVLNLDAVVLRCHGADLLAGGHSDHKCSTVSSLSPWCWSQVKETPGCTCPYPDSCDAQCVDLGPSRTFPRVLP